MEYRNFTIQHNGWPGAEYKYTPKDFQGPEDHRAGTGSSIAECVAYIDEYYGYRMDYRVTRNERTETITRFYTWEEAFKFCIKLNMCPTNIETYVLGQRVNFDSI